MGKLQAAIDLNKLDVTKLITANVLISSGLIKTARDGVRLLGKGTLNSKVDIEVVGASKAAISAVELAGGSVRLLQLEGSSKKIENKHKEKSSEPKKA